MNTPISLIRQLLAIVLFAYCFYLPLATPIDAYATAVGAIDPKNSPENDPAADPCSPTEQGTGGQATSGDPVLIRIGASLERSLDLNLPGPSFQWHHKRSYQSSYGPGEGSSGLVSVLGDRWEAGLISMFIRQEDVDGDTQEDDVVLYMDPTSKRSFTNTGSGYDAPGDMLANLTHDTVNDEFVVEYVLTGDRFVFHDFTVTPEDKRGVIKSRTDRYGNEEITFIYSNNLKRIVQVITPQLFVADYTYLPYSGPYGGRIDKIDLREYVDGPVIQRVRYTYWETGYSSDLGTSGDLLMVQVFMMDTNDDPSSPNNPDDDDFGIELVTQYRYAGGHKLTHVFMPGDVERILADDGTLSLPTDIFGKSNDYSVGSGQELQSYASRSYSYYDSEAEFNEDPTDIVTKWVPSGEDLESKYIESGLDTANVDERVDGGWVKSETVRGREMLTGKFCGNGISREYYYLQIDHTTDSPDKVSFIVVEDKIDAAGSPISRTVYGLNSAGHKLREVLIDNPTAGTPRYWCRSEILGTTGKELNRVKERRLPSAHNVTNEADLRKFLNPTGSGNDSATLRNDDGAIYVFGYNSNGLVTSTKIHEGENGTAYFLSATDYGDAVSNVDDETIWLPKSVFAFRTEETTKGAGDETTFSYTFYDSADTKLETRTTTLPVIDPNENGSDQATQIKEYFDGIGRLRWVKDGDGYVHYLSYDSETGGLAYVVHDVNTTTLLSSIVNGTSDYVGWGDDSPPTGFTRDGGLPGALQVEKEATHDDHGRLTMSSDGEGVLTYIAYEGNDIRVYPGFVNDMDASMGGDQPGPLKPIVVLKRNDYGDVTERIGVDPDGLTIANPPDASESISQSAYKSWVQVDYNEQSFPQTITRYHNIPSATAGSLGDNFYQTWFDYDDRGQRTHIVEIMSGTSSSNAVEQVTKLIYDTTHDHRVVEVARYVSAGDGSNNLGSNFDSYDNAAFKTLKAFEYDGGGIGDGYVTRVVRKHGVGENDYTGETLHRTFRGHLRGIEPFYYDAVGSSETNIGPYVVYDLNWSGVNTARAYYITEPTWTGSGGVLDNDDPNVGYEPYADDTSSGRRTLAKRYVDALGRSYQVETYTIDSGDGSKAKKSVANRYYDRRGNLVAFAPEYEAASEFAYDGVNRLYQGRTVLELEGTKYSSGAFQYRSPTPKPDIDESTDELFMSGEGGNDKVITIEHRVLAGNGNVERFISLQALHSDTDGIDLTAHDDYVQTATYRWYDKAGRATTIANYGSGDTSSGQGQFKYFTLPDRPTTAPTSSTDALLVSSLAYNAAGYVSQITDPKGLDRKFEYDGLGRRIKQAEYDNTDAGIRGTLVQYNGLNMVTALIADPGLNDTISNGAWSTTSDNQVTNYAYTDDYNGRLRTEIEYPDSQSASDVVSLSYTLDGLLTSRSDQRRVSPNATTLDFTYNGRRDLEFQKVTDLISSVDDHVRSIKSGYDNLGRLTSVTSYSDTAGSGTIRNQVVLTYNDLWQLVKSQQSHEGAVTTGTPEVNYGYDTDYLTDSKSEKVYTNGARLSSISYPNERVVHLQYGSADTIWDRLNRTRAILDDNGSGGIGSQLVGYDYLGAGAIVQTDYLEPDLRLNHHHSDNDDDYEGYDRFGRVKEQLWDGYNSTADADQFKYGYDRNSNRVWRKNELTTGYDEFYTYDDLDRLDRLDRGTLNGTAPSYTGVTTPTFAQDWSLDDLGNWTAFKQDDNGDGTGGWDLDQARAHNSVNEIDTDDIDTNGAGASITASTGTNWADPRYDSAGNMILAPRALAPQTARITNTFDAWNRLVEVYDEALQYTLARYEYDGFGRRIVKIVYEEEDPLETRHYYYSAAWQVLEERVDTSTAADRQFIWGERYIDDLILRDRDATTGGNLGKTGSGLDERLYALQDANFNVTALADTSGTVVERFAYQGYGTPKVLDPNWADDLNNQSDYGWETLFAGYRYDGETGLYHVRNRYYHPQLGRWLSRDPLGYIDGMNQYEYVSSRPLIGTDPFGLDGPFGPFLPTDPPIIEPNPNPGLCPPTGGTSLLDSLQIGLDVIGTFEPTPFADGINALISLGRGNKTDAALSALAMVPYVGDALGKGGKIGKALAKHGDEASNLGHASTKPRFIADDAGNVVDTHTTPRGSYTQPNGGRTDILQREDHGAGYSHTHDPITNTNPKTGETFTNGLEQPGRPVSAEDVGNITSGAAPPAPPKGRQ